jgi:transcriptional regulator with XRE-family HTH domain
MNADDFYRKMILAELERRNMSMNALATAAGVSATGLRDILSGKIGSTTVERLEKIAKALDIPIRRFFDTEAIIVPGNHDIDIVRSQALRVVGSVQAGAWLEELPFDMDPEPETIPVSPDPRFDPALPQYALRVRGESMNEIFQDGDFACCVDVETYRSWRTDDLAVVVRSRDQGALWEATIKQVVIKDAETIELWPRSTDPRYKTPLVLRADDGDAEIRLKSLVLGRYQPLAVRV